MGTNYNKNSIFFWHHFEQNEAAIFDKILTNKTRSRSFVEINRVVDTVEEHGILTSDDIEWMRDKLEDIATRFPEIITNEN